MRKITILFILLAAATVTFAQQTPTPTPVQSVVQQSSAKPVQSEAKKAFAKLKTLSGSWQGTIMTIPIDFIIRPASSGTAILHEGHTEKGPPNREITMFYMDGDRLLATHYCDAGNRTNMEGKLSADEKSLEFNFIEVIGSKRGGFLQNLVFRFSPTDAASHVIELTFVQPDGTPIPLKGDFKKSK